MPVVASEEYPSGGVRASPGRSAGLRTPACVAPQETGHVRPSTVRAIGVTLCLLGLFSLVSTGFSQERLPVLVTPSARADSGPSLPDASGLHATAFHRPVPIISVASAKDAKNVRTVVVLDTYNSQIVSYACIIAEALAAEPVLRERDAIILANGRIPSNWIGTMDSVPIGFMVVKDPKDLVAAAAEECVAERPVIAVKEAWKAFGGDGISLQVFGVAVGPGARLLAKR